MHMIGWFGVSKDTRIALCHCEQVAKRFKGKVTREENERRIDELEKKKQ